MDVDPTPDDVALQDVTSWHVEWSHDGRPTLVLDHPPVIRRERRRQRTILWFRIGGGSVDGARRRTRIPFPGRRDDAYRGLVQRLTSLGVPRGDDVERRPAATRDERLGASVRPLLLWREQRGGNRASR
jgi:hypothetical protein